MEILPNLYFVDFYRRNGNFSKYIAVLKSRQRTHIATRIDSKPKKSCYDRRKFAETKTEGVSREDHVTTQF